jgi:hypothetical protein
MATIINTMEVVLEQAPPKPAPQTAPSGQTPPLTPRDLEDVLERQVRAVARLAAH